MSEYKQYNPYTGEIISTMILPDDIAQAAIEHGENLIKAEGDSQTHYVDINAVPPVLKLRPKQDTTQDKFQMKANNLDTLTLNNLPIPCIVSFNDNASYEVDDGILQWSTNRPDRYKIIVRAFPFLDYESEVIANAS